MHRVVTENHLRQEKWRDADDERFLRYPLGRVEKWSGMVTEMECL